MNLKEQFPVLIVDDEEIILLALKETILSEGYSVVTSNDPTKAIELIKNKKFSVIISDQKMTEMNGLDFLKQAKEIQSNASRVLITGVFTLKTIIESINKAEIFRFISKPWMREDLVLLVKESFQKFENIYESNTFQNNILQSNREFMRQNVELQEQISKFLEKI